VNDGGGSDGGGSDYDDDDVWTCARSASADDDHCVDNDDCESANDDCDCGYGFVRPCSRSARQDHASGRATGSD